MNPSTALATVLVDELVRGGVSEVVLCPGSRNAALSMALHAADAAGRLRLHVRIDERTAGFLALGLAKASGRPVPVVTTSGTAAVNLHPAVVEAAYAGVPLVAVTADRPPELKGVGANQTIDQDRLFGSAATYVDVRAAEAKAGEVARWRATFEGALAGSRRGPVHLNVAFRDPLLPDGSPDWVEPLEAGGAAPPAEPRAAGSPAPATVGGGADEGPDPGGSPVDLLEPGPRTVVVAGSGAGPAARRLAEAAGWPLLAEPASGARGGPCAVATYRLLLDVLGADIERVVVLGRPTLSRPVTRLLARTELELVVVATGNHRSQPSRPHARTVGAVWPCGVAMDAPPATGTPSAAPSAPPPEADAWLMRWLEADRVAREAINGVLGNSLNGPVVARVVAGALCPGQLLVCGSSAPIRDLDLADAWSGTAPAVMSGSPRPLGGGEPDDSLPQVLANRGAAGIDGTVSTAVGAALAHGGHAYALMGDLTFLHDATGLVIGPDEPRPDLTIVVANDDGGAIFSTLEQGAPEHAAAFERVFGTPHGVDVAALCAATHTPHTVAASVDELRAALTPRPGICVVEVPLDRSTRRDLDQRLKDAVAAAVEA